MTTKIRTIDDPVRVLIAEDEALVAALTRSELQARGYTVVGIAPDGRKVVDMVDDLRPSVVVMDIEMPLTDGLTAAAAIQLSNPTPVVILTAHPEAANLDKAAAAGVGAFLVKPPQADEIERALTIAIARHADLMDLRRLNEELKQTLAEVRTLKGLLPICCSCKKIRDDQGYWNEVEAYIMKRTDAVFSHGYCPQCLAKYFPSVVLPESEADKE